MLYNNWAVYTQPRTCKSVMKGDLVCVALAWCCAMTAETRAWACQQCLADKRQAPLQPFCRSGCCKSFPHRTRSISLREYHVTRSTTRVISFSCCTLQRHTMTSCVHYDHAAAVACTFQTKRKEDSRSKICVQNALFLDANNKRSDSYKTRWAVFPVLSSSSSSSSSKQQLARSGQSMMSSELLKRSAADSGNPLQQPLILQHVLDYVGPGHWSFVAEVSSLWRDLYVNVPSIDVDIQGLYKIICVPQMTACSAVFASPSRVRHAHAHDLACTTERYERAAGQYAGIDSLQAARELGMYYTHEVMRGAARSGELAVVAFMRAQGCP
eukprot:5618-Heterococcus_DN1.PRE.1